MKEKIYYFLQQVPRGKVVTYGDIAKLFGIHPRTIAQILSTNQDQGIFPCYKVIHTDGRIGGYNLGIEEKILRLGLDGIPIENNRIKKEYIWKNFL